MTVTDLTKIEQAIGQHLPTSYRDFMTRYPEELASIAGDFEFLADADRIVQLNDDLRRMPFYQGKSWPDRLLAIGENGCGDYYFLDLRDASGAVLFVDHETMDYQTLASNVEEWAPKLMQELRP
ncbi:MAG: SMI1/KNR4 family protein [Verrucomicrobiales bacterium]|nr:SMI1/KNR4 family protein [Verrucomicrobiales bacterium]